jgi:hypothetical protein
MRESSRSQPHHLSDSSSSVFLTSGSLSRPDSPDYGKQSSGASLSGSLPLRGQSRVGRGQQQQRPNSGANSFRGTKASEARGCSWSQFLIIVNLFCNDQTHLIPSVAFNIDDEQTHHHLRSQPHPASIENRTYDSAAGRYSAAAILYPPN